MRRIVLVLTVVAIAAAGAWAALRIGGTGERDAALPRDGERVLAEVLNASGADGLARRVTRALRERGIDVVYFGTAPFDTLAETRCVVRRGDTLAAGRIRELLGTGTVTVEPDPGLLLDVTVLLGRDAAALGFQP